MSEPPVQTKIVERTIIKPQRPAKVEPKEISYITITRDTMDKDVLAGQAYMCLSWQDYLTLAQWEQDKLRFIRQANEIINYYEDTLENKEEDNGND